MLTLGRRVGEKLIIDDKIIVTLLEIQVNQAIIAVENLGSKREEYRLKIREKIDIRKDISLTIFNTDVPCSIGVDAPKHISIHREEVYSNIKSKQEAVYAELKASPNHRGGVLSLNPKVQSGAGRRNHEDRLGRMMQLSRDDT